MVKADAKLVKGVMETSGLGQTEGNEWNVLWTSQSIKSYIYEAMNEYQKINHFPMSNELTRKDRLCENIVKMQDRTKRITVIKSLICLILKAPEQLPKLDP